MTATPALPTQPDIAISRDRARLWTPITTHTVTDFLSFVTIALMPLLAVRLAMDPTQKATLLALGSVASGGIQPLVAWFNDRYDTRATGTIGLAVAAVSIGLIGLTQSFPQLLALFLLGAMGVGAFHPAAAAAVGQAAATRRSAMLSVFFLFGMIGGVSGNVLSPQLVGLAAGLSGKEGPAATDAGLAALVWLIPVGLSAAAVLAWAIHGVPHRHGDAHATHASLPRDQRQRRWNAVWLLYACNVIRFTVNQMLVYLTFEWTERVVAARSGVTDLDLTLGQTASEINGPLQGAMQVGMGAGALALGFLLTAKHEKAAFVLVPVVGAAAIAIIPRTEAFLDSGYLAVVGPAALLTVVAGVGFGSLIPISMSLAQRLLPHRTALASGLMLGGAWALASVGPFVSRLIHAADDANLDAGFMVAGGLLLGSSALALMLPTGLIREVGGR